MTAPTPPPLQANGRTYKAELILADNGGSSSFMLGLLTCSTIILSAIASCLAAPGYPFASPPPPPHCSSIQASTGYADSPCLRRSIPDSSKNEIQLADFTRNQPSATSKFHVGRDAKHAELVEGVEEKDPVGRRPPRYAAHARQIPGEQRRRVPVPSEEQAQLLAANLHAFV